MPGDVQCSYDPTGSSFRPDRLLVACDKFIGAVRADWKWILEGRRDLASFNYPPRPTYDTFYLDIEVGPSGMRLVRAIRDAHRLGLTVSAIVLCGRGTMELQNGDDAVLENYRIFLQFAKPIDDAKRVKMTAVICPPDRPPGFYD
jgi:hypothetical protein